ncbi:FAD-dependent monooxygenase [Dermacoccus abyssi]
MNTIPLDDGVPSNTPVLIVGAGPSGLMLAAELALAGTQPLLIDALEGPTGQSRALGFTVRTLEIFQQRGILPRFGDLNQQSAVHFAGLVIEGRHLSSELRPANQYPQSRTEEALSGWASDLGVKAHRPWRLDSLQPTDEGYRCELSGPQGNRTVTARFVVGCDGAHSRVRHLARIPVQRTEPSVQMLVADLKGSGLADQPFGVKHTGGMVMSAPLGDGTERVIVCDFSQPFLPRGTEVSGEEVRTAYENVVGAPLDQGQCLWASSFTDASSLVQSYRSEGILLVGDSAHTHLPAGGQGMNVSIQDAVNLGWKLAAVCQGRAPETLLDTYQAERLPVAQELLRNTATQGQLFLRGPEVDPVRHLLSDLLQVPGVATRLADSVSGLDVRYAFTDSDGPSLIGSRLAPGTLIDMDTGSDAAEHLRHGQSLLVMLAEDEDLIAEAHAWMPHVRIVWAWAARSQSDCDIAAAHAVLVRPDGHIAWIGRCPEELRASLTFWLGTPAAQPQEV